jgi:hypothetical protein
MPEHTVHGWSSGLAVAIPVLEICVNVNSLKDLVMTFRMFDGGVGLSDVLKQGMCIPDHLYHLISTGEI